jgi:hypothetical protein
MSLEHAPVRQPGAARPQVPAADPILTFQECADELGVKRRTFWRAVLPHLETVRLSPQRRGVRRSVLERFKRARTVPAEQPLEAAS